MSPSAPFKLLARDAEDLGIVAACLQDAVVLVREIRYLPDERRFVLAVNRFRWEAAGRERSEEGAPVYERVHCGVCFENVTAVRQLGLDRGRVGQIVSLLTVERGEGTVELTFSGGAAVRLEVDDLLCHVQDLDEPWPTRWRPAHPLDDEA